MAYQGMALSWTARVQPIAVGIVLLAFNLLVFGILFWGVYQVALAAMD